MTYAIYILSLFLVAFLGFASHRASLCTVRAVAEILSTRQAYIFLSFAKAVLWVMAVSLLIAWLAPGHGIKFQSHAPAWAALAGGFLFGIGAAVNGGCSFSTLQRLADGELWMLATLAGYCAGAAGWYAIGGTLAVAAMQPVSNFPAERGQWLLLLGLLWVWGAWELVRLWRERPRGIGIWQLVSAGRYRLSAAALVVGMSGGALYILQGSWTYTNTLRREAAFLLGTEGAPQVFQGLMFLALFLGMMFSSWQRGSFRLRAQPAGNGLRFVLGGLMMGLGGTVVPGGNDTLILTGIPAFSSQALGVYLALITGVTSTLLLMRVFRGPMMRVDCSGDMCRTDH